MKGGVIAPAPLDRCPTDRGYAGLPGLEIAQGHDVAGWIAFRVDQQRRRIRVGVRTLDLGTSRDRYTLTICHLLGQKPLKGMRIGAHALQLEHFRTRAAAKAWHLGDVRHSRG